MDRAEFSNMFTSFSTDMEILEGFVFLFVNRISFRVLGCGEWIQRWKPGGLPGFLGGENGLWKIGTVGIIWNWEELSKHVGGRV